MKRLRTTLCMTILATVPVWATGGSAAFARDDSEHDKRHGNPIAKLQRQIDALSARVATLEGTGPAPTALEGDYAFTATETCSATRTGFDGNFNASDALAIRHFVTDGVLSYQTNGTGTATFRTRLVIEGTQQISERQASCSLTYTVNPDGTLSQVMNCTVNVTAGLIAGNTLSIVGIQENGRLLQGGKLLLTSAQPVIESVDIQPLGIQLQRVCARSGVAGRIP